MNNKPILTIVVLLSLNMLITISAFAQVQRSIIIKNSNGEPISGAMVIVGEAGKPIYSDQEGKLNFEFNVRTTLLIEADGYESKLVQVTPSMTVGTVKLEKAPYQMGGKNKVNLPFGQFDQRLIPGAVAALDVREILKYDQQKSFSGIINGRIPGLFGSNNFRQYGAPLIVVDGIPRPATDYNPEQIQQITVIKDLASAMLYGSQAENGVILITTQRGEPLKNSWNLTGERGIFKPISYPKYLNAADYMGLYNEALSNDGLDLKYTSEQIENTRKGIDPVRYPDEDYYNSTYLKDSWSYQNVVGEASGGNEVGQYYLNLGWNRETGLLKLGEGGNEKNDRLNMRGNINYKLRDNIELLFDGAAIFNFRRAPRYSNSNNDFWSLASSLRPNISPVLIPASLMKDEDLLGAAKLVDGKYLLGGTREFPINVYGELTRNGPRKTTDRLIELTTKLKFNLDNITPGLSASAFISANMYNVFLTDILNSYAVYQPNYDDTGTIQSWTKYGRDAKVESQTLSSLDFYRRTGAYGTIDYHRTYNDNHKLSVNALAYGEQYSTEGTTQVNKHLHFGVRTNYSYQNKYIAELTGVYTGSGKLFETNPWTMSPGIGLGWIVTEENFLKDYSTINYLKVRTNWAIINTVENMNDYYIGRDRFYSSGTYYYGQRSFYNSGTILTLGNPNAKAEKKMNYNLGFESMLFDYKLGIEGSYFYYKYYDVLTTKMNELPAYIVSPPFENFGSYQTQGVELGVNYTQKIDNLEISIGSNFGYSVPKVLVIDELQFPDNEKYRQLTGRESDAVFGYVALGLFKDQNEIENAPFQSFGKVSPMDIRYKDLNGDGQITDADRQIIGNSNSRIQYGLNLHLKYNFIELFALGIGQQGEKRTFSNQYYWVEADRKYSDVVLKAGNPGATATTTYPRLTTLSASNNFRNSTFWIQDNNWFTLQTLQLTYVLPEFLSIKEARIYLRGSNLLTISGLKDKTQLNIGSAPQARYMSLGLNISF